MPTVAGRNDRVALSTMGVMRRLFLSVCICTAVMGSLSLAAMVIGRAQPEGEFIPSAEWCGGMPCYMDIALGKTTRFEAGRMLSRAGYAKDPDDDNRYQSTGLIRELAFRSDDGRGIDGIALYLGENALTAGRFVQRWGTPCAVYFGINSPTVTCACRKVHPAVLPRPRLR